MNHWLPAASISSSAPVPATFSAQPLARPLPRLRPGDALRAVLVAVSSRQLLAARRRCEPGSSGMRPRSYNAHRDIESHGRWRPVAAAFADAATRSLRPRAAGLGAPPARRRARRPLGPLGGLPLDLDARPAGRGRSPVNDTTMPHIHDDLPGARASRRRSNGPAADRRSCCTPRSSRRRRRLVGFALGATFGFALAVAARRTRASLQRGVPAVHRRVADDPDPRDRADGRRLARPEVPALTAGSPSR